MLVKKNGKVLKPAFRKPRPFYKENRYTIRKIGDYKSVLLNNGPKTKKIIISRLISSKSQNGYLTRGYITRGSVVLTQGGKKVKLTTISAKKLYGCPL